MHFKVLLPAFGVWLVMVVLAFANGAFRQTVLIPRLSLTAAGIISTVILASLILLLAWLFVGRVKDRYDARDMLLTGIFWMVLTMVFEFGLGLAMGASWKMMLADYNILKGRIWVVIPVVTLIAPYVVYRLMEQ